MLFLSSREALLLRSVVRARFQFVILTGVAVEEDDLLCGLVLRLRHCVSPSGIGLAGSACAPCAEALASSDASASCYRRSENVRVLAVIVAERKLVQVQGQILLADVVEAAHDAALEQRPEALDIVGMHFAAHILVLGVLHRAVRETARLQIVIAAVLVGRDQRYALADRIAHEPIQSSRVCVFDDLADHVTLAADSADHRGLSAHAGDVLLLVPVAVLIFAAQGGFVHFDDPHQLLEIVVAHTGAEPMADIPSGMRRGALAKEHSADLARRHTFQALEHRIKNAEPNEQGDVRVLKDRPDQYREAIGRIVQVGLVAAEPIERAGLRGIDLFVSALRALHFTVGPAAIRKVLSAGFFIGIARHELLKRHHENIVARAGVVVKSRNIP